jgi:hypothetical protein
MVLTAHYVMLKVHVVLLKVVQKVRGIVVMDSVFQMAMYVMAQVNSVTLDGDLTVPMVQMKA